MDFNLNILGTASALPTSDRYSSAHVLDVHGRLFLIDCGEGTQMQMRRMGISFLKVDNICISHIHGDHVFGLFGLLSTMGMLGRTAAMHIYAPASFAKVLKFFMSCFGEGLKFGIEHHVLSSSGPELVMENKSMELLAFPLKHRIETYGFLFKEKEPAFNVRKESIAKYGLTLSEIATLKRGEDVIRPAGEDTVPSVSNGFRCCSGTSEPLLISAEEAAYKPYSPRSYAYCSDTAPFPELAEWVRGADLLYHEATYPSEMAELAAKTFHSTAKDAAECALASGAVKLLIGHYSSRYFDLRPFLEEARSVFPNTVLARERDVIRIPHRFCAKQNNASE